MIDRDITMTKTSFNLPSGLYYRIGNEYPRILPDGIVYSLVPFLMKESVDNQEIKEIMKIIFLFMDNDRHSENNLWKHYLEESVYIMYIYREKELGLYFHFDSDSLSFCYVQEFLVWI